MRISVNAAGVVLQVPGAPGSRVVWPAEGEPVVEAVTVAAGGLLVVDGPKSDLAAKLAKAGALDAGVAPTFVASLQPGDGRVELRFEPRPSGDAVLVPLDRDPVTPEWADDFELTPPPLRGPPFPSAGRARVAVSEDSVAVVVETTGVCALARVVAGDRAPRLVLRFKMAKGDSLHALPTPAGLLVTHLANGRHATVMHVDERGKLLGDWEGWGSPPALWVGDEAVVYDDDAAKGGHRLRADLLPMGGLDVPFRPLASAVSPDGAHFAFADGANLLRGTRRADGALVTELLAWGDVKRTVKRTREPTGAVAAYAPRRAHGLPSLGFPAKPVVAPPWNAKVGPFAVTLAIRSTGGEGRGVHVEASGPALASLHLTHAEHEGARVPFELKGGVASAVLPAIPLEAGLLLPLEPGPKGDAQARIAEALLLATHLRVHLIGTASAPSRELLAVTLRVPGVASAPLKWTRPFVVE